MEDTLFRDNGAVGALLDEYERALTDLKLVLSDVTDEELVQVVDPETEDPDCKSVQSVMAHVVRSGFGYAIEVRKFMGEDISFRTRQYFSAAVEYIEALDEVMHFNEQLFADYPELVLEEHDPAKKILVNWGQRYDVEQIFEHAIVHILRHRRQIERFLIAMRGYAGYDLDSIV